MSVKRCSGSVFVSCLNTNIFGSHRLSKDTCRQVHGICFLLHHHVGINLRGVDAGVIFRSKQFYFWSRNSLAIRVSSSVSIVSKITSSSSKSSKNCI